MNRKASTQAAIHNFLKKEYAKGSTREPQRKNKKPERETEHSVFHWAKYNGFFLHVIDSSTYDPILCRKGTAKAQSGMPDLIGNTPNGLACYIELKAEGRRSNLSLLQQLFLEQKIDQSCFAVVVDSAEKLAQYWRGFCSLKTSVERQKYLKDCLPKKSTREKPPRDKFEEEHGF